MSESDPNLIRKELHIANIAAYLNDIDRVLTALSAENLRPSTCAKYQSFLKVFSSSR